MAQHIPGSPRSAIGKVLWMTASVRSMYAHLSRIDVRVGVWIGEGVRVGLVGATGDATGPHLHFEVRIRGASVDPLRALP